MRWSLSHFVVRAAMRLVLSACVALMDGTAHAAQTILAGPVEVRAPGDQRETPALIALVADADRLGGANNYPDLFQIVALPANRDLASAVTLAVLPDQPFHYAFPPRPMTRVSAISIDPDGRRLYAAMSKSYGDNTSVEICAYAIARDEVDLIRLDPIAEGPRRDGISTVSVGLLLEREDQERGPVRVIKITPTGDRVRVELHVSEDDDEPIVYEVSTADWGARRISQIPSP